VRTRRIVWTGSSLTLAVLTATVGLTARGQERPPTAPKTNPAKTAPPTGRSTVPPAYRTPASDYPDNPRPGATRPRITQPVMAGPDGVRPVSVMPPVLPAPAADPKLPEPKPLDVPKAGSPETDRPTDPVPPPPALPGGTPATMPAVPSMPAVPADPPAAPKPPAVESTRPSFQEQPAPLPATSSPLPSRAAPSLTVDLVAPEAVGVGQPLTYELVVRNVGTSPAVNVRVEDEVPARCTLVGCEPSAETSGDRLAWSLGAMDPGVEKRIKVTVKPGDEGELRTRAAVTFASAVEARVKVTRPRVAVAVSGPEANRVGEKVPFTIKLSNTGTGPAARVMLRAQFSDGLAHPQGQVIEAELTALKAGETRTLSLEAVGLKSGAQTCVLTASADGSAVESARASVTLVEPMLVAKQAGPARCLVRAEPVYQIELSNPGTAATDPVQLWASLPAGFEFVSATDGGAFADANRAVGWRLPGLPAGSTKVVTLKVRATAPSEGVIRTVAMASASAEAVMPAGGVPNEAKPAKGLEARAETPVKAEGVPALRFEVVDLEDPIMVGAEAVYEVRVTNSGTGPCTNVLLVAELAEGTSAAGAAGPTNGRVTGQQIAFDPIPTLGVKAEAVYKVRVKGSAAGDQRFRMKLSCDQIRTPVIKEENTRFYSQ
jgi:uncharacterized repeat protein (TIGR01451 family)